MSLAAKWVSIDGAASLESCKSRAIEKRIQKGKYTTRKINGNQQGKTRTEIRADSLSKKAQKKVLEFYSSNPTPTEPKQRQDTGGGTKGSPQHNGSKSVAIESCTAEAALPWFDSQPPEHKKIIEQRLEIIQSIEKEIQTSESRTAILKELCTKNNIGIDTFYRWRKGYQEHGLQGLACKKFGSSRAKLTKVQQGYILSLIKDKPHRRIERIFEYVALKFPETEISGSTVRRFVNTWKKNNASLFKFIQNPDAWKGQHMVAYGSESEKATYVNHFWETDSTPADLLLADNKRYNIAGMLDIYPRRAKCHVSKTSNSHAIANVIRESIIDWGLPTNIVSDNGKDFTSKHVKTICESLGINQVVVPPFSPEKKPHIERFFRTLSTGLFEELQGYIGHSVAERKDIEAQKTFAQRFMSGGQIELNLMPEQLQEIIDRWIENVYHQRRHGGIKMAPEIKAAQCTMPKRHVVNVRALDILLQPMGTRIVQKKGIDFETGIYVSPNLVSFDGQKVKVRVSSESAGQLYVFNLENEFLTTAIDSRLVDFTAVEWRELRKAQRAILREQKNAIETLTNNPMMDLIENAEGTKKIKGIKKRKAVHLKEANAALEGVGLKPTQYKSIAEQEAERKGRDLEQTDELDFVDDLEILDQELNDDDDSLDFLDDIAING